MSTRPNGLAMLLGTPGRAVAILIVFVTVTGIALGSMAFLLFGPRGGSSSASGGGSGPRRAAPAGQPCTQAPQAVVDDLALTSGGLAVTLRLTGGCGSDDVLTGSAVGLSISGGSTDVAAAVFDLTGSPIALPADGDATRTFVFPAGMYWRIPELVAEQYSNSDLTATLTGLSHGSGSGGYGSSVTARSPLSPAYGSADATAAAALGELMVFDRSAVSSSLENWWVPQVSSKRVGLYADGITYGNEDILRNHLQLRQQYDNVRLLWANDWSTFNYANWWVTIVGQPYSDAGQANGWCDGHGIGVDDCFAKVVSTSRGPSGTTVLRN